MWLPAVPAAADSWRSEMRKRPSIRLIPYDGAPADIAIHGSLAVALDSSPPPGRLPRPVLGVVGDERPSVRVEARLISQLVLDVLIGVRPYHHLAGRTTPQLFERLESLAARLPARAMPRLGTVRVCEPGPGVAEVAAVAAIGPRAQALALRLEFDRRWRCAAVETTVPPG
jgi:hypothetical protein